MTRQRQDPYLERKGLPGLFTWLSRLFLFAAVLTACATAGLLLYGRYQGGDLSAPVGGANLLQRLYLQGYLLANAGQLAKPVGSGDEPVRFVIAPGENAEEIAEHLAEEGLLSDRSLFLNYLRLHGIDSGLEAGTYELSPQLTLPELAAALTDAAGQDLTVRFTEGWRVEQMAAYLETICAEPGSTEKPGFCSAHAFLAYAERRQPLDLSQHDFLASLPADATLEGYLFPDTYRLPRDASAAQLVEIMLANFGRRITPAMRQAFGAQGLSLREAVTLASIVEREAVVAAERPLMAGVFLNRLAQGMRLDADPTVQYALGYQPESDSWWKSPLSLADLAIDSPYNTYLVPSLPPGPIANPGLASLEAVAEPAETPYLYFVVDCTRGDGSHHFSATYDEHLAKVQSCRGS